ncbi:MAG: hypothetical protein RLZZ387_586 [Chloroflexota bacterium]|jgi:hypothetical protein
MRRSFASVLVACGAIMALFGVGGWTGSGVASAQVVVPQPSPRPPVRSGDDGSSSAVIAPDTGRVTGTVINVTTGAPVAGVQVIVGGELVTTDANGNYDHWMPIGSYVLQVVPDPSLGQAAQPALTVVVRAREVTVQHLGMQGAVVAPPSTDLPAVAPAPAAVEAAAAPVEAVPAPVEAAAAPVEAASADPALDGPRTLPRTGLEADGSWVWVGGGMLLVLAGWVLFGLPVARLAPALSRRPQLPAGFDSGAMLASLLGARDTSRAPRDELLEELFASDEIRRR